MEQSLVSVIITTYKRPVSQLSQAIDSVLAQTHANLELIVVDDSPAEYEHRGEVAAYCRAIPDGRVRYIQHEKNLGACAARNTGVAAGSGEYLSFLDDDDVYLPERLEKMLPLFNAPEVVLVYADADICEEGVSTRKHSDRQRFYEGDVHEKIMAVNFIGSTSMAMLRRSALEKAGGFDPEMEASQDWDVWIRVSRLGQVHFTKEILTRYNIHGSAASDRITNDTARRIRALHRLNEKDAEYLSKNPKVMAERLRYEMRLHIAMGDVQSALSCYQGVVQRRPRAFLKNAALLKAFGGLFVKR